MTAYRHRIVNSLAFRIIVPVTAVVGVMGFGLYVVILRSVSDFADRQIKESLLELSRAIYSICDKGLHELIEEGMTADLRAVKAKKAMVAETIGGFMLQNNLKGIVLEGGRELICDCETYPSLSDAARKTIQENTFSLIRHEGRQYYLYKIPFEPWQWDILLIKDAAAHAALLRDVKIAHGVTGGVLFLATILLLSYLNRTIARPVNDIIAPLERGELPVYKGPIRELAFISSRIGGIVAALEEKTRWINHIYQIAVTRRGDEFFGEIATTIGKMFGMSSLIATVNNNGSDAHIVAQYLDGALRRDMTISLKGTPCEGVCAKRQLVIVERDAFRMFPDAAGLRASQAESYIGFPVFDRKDEVIGVVNASGPRREFSESDINVLKTIGQIVAAEFEILEKEREEERLMEQILQEQRLKSINVLVSGVAHNFNNMLVGVLGYASFVSMQLREARERDEAIGGEALEALLRHMESIERASERASNLARELSKLAKGKALGEDAAGPVAVNTIIADLEQLLSNTFPKNIEIVTGLAEHLSPVRGDASQIEQAVLNICINGRDAMPEGGRLAVTTFELLIADKDPRYPYLPPGRYVTIMIADTGTGIDKEVLSHIFEPFFTTKPVDKGTGLGLATVHAIVKSHNGHIAVESTVGRGTQFTIHLPAL